MELIGEGMAGSRHEATRKGNELGGHARKRTATEKNGIYWRSNGNAKDEKSVAQHGAERISNGNASGGHDRMRIATEWR